MAENEKTAEQYWIRTQLEEPSPVLLIAKPQEDDSPRRAQEITTTVGMANESVLVISDPNSSNTWLSDWTSELSYTPNNLDIIEMVSEDNLDPGKNQVVASSGDLSDLETHIIEFLQQARKKKAQPVLLFDSLSALYTSVENDVCQAFLNCITDECRTLEAFAFFHVDPEDEETRKFGEKIFDATAEFDPKARRWRVY